MSHVLLDWPAAASAGPARAGGKGWQLGLLAGFGLPVPPGFVIEAVAVAERRRGEALPPALVQALADELARRDWTDRPLAVRSSAAAEDSARASFAGIYRSRLNVRGIEALVAAVQDVLDSATQPIALAYRERMDLSGVENAMAVVVMPLLPAVASGVAFTVDPSTGRQDQLLIEANWGLGEALVGGHSEGDQYRLQHDYPGGNWRVVMQRRGAKTRMCIAGEDGDSKLQETPRQLATQSVLSPAQTVALGDLVRDVATALDYTKPFYDVEWVWDGHSFWIVQARPITARGQQTYPALAYQPMLWSRGNSRDVVPNPFPAMDWSVSGLLIHRMLTKTGELAGYAALPGVQRTTLHQGRLYFETSVLQWESFDAFGLPPKSYNQLMGGHHAEICVPAASLGQRLSRAWRGTRFLLKIIKPRSRARSTLLRAHQEAQQLLALTLPANPNELADQLRAQTARMLSAEELMLLQVSGSAFLLLLNLMEQYFPDEGGALTAALMSDGEPSVTAFQTYELVQLAEVAAVDKVALAWLGSPQRAGQQWQLELSLDSPFRRAFEKFLERFGHRGVYESYLHRPRWHEDPTYLLDTIVSLIGFDASELQARQRTGHAAAQRRIRQRLPIWQRALVQWLVKRAINESNVREGARSALIAYSAVVRRLVLSLAQQLAGVRGFPSPGDVFHLTSEELLALAESRLTAAAAARRACWRRQQYQSFEMHAVDEVMIEHRGAAVLDPSPPSVSVQPCDGNEWRGLVVGAGCAEGFAFMANHPDDTITMPAGAILVAPATDPSWTPAFLKAAAIVMETGGYLSHGAIVAREFGIPAVVNVPGILTALNSGDWLEVDAHRGVIRRSKPV